MKNPSGVRLFGLILIILSSLGLLFAVTGIASIWVFRPKVNGILLSLTDAVDDTLTNTSEMLNVLDSTLDNVSGNFSIIRSTFDNLDVTITNISDSMDTSAALVGDNLKITIIDTQTALSSASSSAVIIDKTLSVLAAIPYWGADYQPEVPLHTSLEQVASSLDGIPGSLETLEENLTNTADGLTMFNSNLSELSTNIEMYEADLGEAQQVLKDYSNIIDRIQTKLGVFNQNVTTYLTYICLFLTGILFFLAISLLNPFLKGISGYIGERHTINLADINRE